MIDSVRSEMVNSSSSRENIKSPLVPINASLSDFNYEPIVNSESPIFEIISERNFEWELVDDNVLLS